MADGLLDMIIQSANFDNLTAVAADGLSGKSFVGKNGSTYNGNIVDRGAPTYSLPVNGSITLPAGKYSGGTAEQNLITMNGYTAYPGSKNITVPTKDKYMTGNITIASLPNLKPENIKEGEYVGGVGPGTWKGYVVNNPNTFYYRGTFGPGQSLDDYIALDSQSYKAERTNELKYLLYTPTNNGNNGGGAVYGVFNSPTDLTSISKARVKYSIYKNVGTSSWDFKFNVYLTREKNTRYQAINGLKIASSENEFTQQDIDEDVKTAEIDVTNLSRDAYLSFYIYMSLPRYRAKIHSVEFI